MTWGSLDLGQFLSVQLFLRVVLCVLINRRLTRLFVSYRGLWLWFEEGWVQLVCDQLLASPQTKPKLNAAHLSSSQQHAARHQCPIGLHFAYDLFPASSSQSCQRRA
eukprot:3421084-Amphidinium_carterae.1